MPNPAKLYHTDQAHFLRRYVTYSDSGIVAGTLEMDSRLPKNAMHIATHVWMATASTAGNVLTVGTTSGTANSMVTSGDINETVQAYTRVAGIGVVSSASDLPVYVKWATGTSGAAYIAVEFLPFPPNS